MKAEEMQSQIKSTVYTLDQGIEAQLEISFGIATFPDQANDLTSLLGIADRELFSVKVKSKDALGRYGR